MYKIVLYAVSARKMEVYYSEIIFVLADSALYTTLLMV